jgi:hypothetical protein
VCRLRSQWTLTIVIVFLCNSDCYPLNEKTGEWPDREKKIFLILWAGADVNFKSLHEPLV